MNTITSRMRACFCSNVFGPKDLTREPSEAINALSFLPPERNISNYKGWSHAGWATITVEVADERELIAGKVDSLRDEINAVNAEALATATRLQAQINELLTITYEAVS